MSRGHDQHWRWALWRLQCPDTNGRQPEKQPAPSFKKPKVALSTCLPSASYCSSFKRIFGSFRVFIRVPGFWPIRVCLVGWLAVGWLSWLIGSSWSTRWHRQERASGTIWVGHVKILLIHATINHNEEQPWFSTGVWVLTCTFSWNHV